MNFDVYMVESVAYDRRDALEISTKSYDLYSMAVAKAREWGPGTRIIGLTGAEVGEYEDSDCSVGILVYVVGYEYDPVEGNRFDAHYQDARPIAVAARAAREVAERARYTMFSDNLPLPETLDGNGVRITARDRVRYGSAPDAPPAAQWSREGIVAFTGHNADGLRMVQVQTDDGKYYDVFARHVYVIPRAGSGVVA